jgi:hypothetical protein
MSLRFAIIKHKRSLVGQQWEDIVFENDEAEVIKDLLMFFEKRLTEKRSSRFGKTKYTMEDALECLRHAFYDTIEDFKRITVRIM